MEVICAWCGTKMREGEPPTSHGMCRTCQAEVIRDSFPEQEAAMILGDNLIRHDCPIWGVWVDLGNGG